MPYLLGAGRMAKFRDWFLDPAFPVQSLPGYAVATSADPFAAFRDLPLEGRYRFLPDEAEFFVVNFIKGPVCRGQLALDATRGACLAFMPEVMFLRVGEPGRAAHYLSVLRDTAHKNVAHVFKAAQELIPAENRLTVVPGFVGAYPNALFSVRPGEVAAFASAVGALNSEADYRRLADRFAIRRTNPAFWADSDEVLAAFAAWAPAEAGLFDYRRLESR